MNCPNCGAWAYEDNIGRWFCSESCGWNSGYTFPMGERHGMSFMWTAGATRQRGGMVLHKLRLAVRLCPWPPVGGSTVLV